MRWCSPSMRSRKPSSTCLMWPPQPCGSRRMRRSRAGWSTPRGLLYVSRPDASTNAEVNVLDLDKGEPRFKDAIESGKPMSSSGYDAERYYLHHVIEGRTMYVFANRDHQLYAVDRETGTYKALGGEVKLQGGEDPVDMEI